MREESPPPETGAPRPVRPRRKTDDDLKPVYGNKPRLASSGEQAPTKALLKHVGDVWLFEIREAGRVSYAVEQAEHVWKFTLLYSAQNKFAREVNKVQGGSENG